MRHGAREISQISLGGVMECTSVLANRSERRVENCLHSLLRWLGLSHTAIRTAVCIALIPAVVGLTLGFLDSETLMIFRKDHKNALKVDAAVFSGFSFVLGFLLVFRASMAYSRYWSAITSVLEMGSQWFDAASSLVAFSAHSKAPPETVLSFRHLVVRLLSICHVSALANLMDSGVDDEAMLNLKTIDPLCLDAITLSCFDAPCQRIEVVGQWIQHAVVRAMEDEVFSAPPPIISRSLQQFGNGMVNYHDALKAKHLQFPEMYQNMCDVLLGLHWIGSPFLISLYCNSPFLTFVFTFSSVFALWSLSLVAKVIENPFGTRHIAKEVTIMHNDLNAKLLLLTDPKVARCPEMINFPLGISTSSRAKLVPFHEVLDSVGHGTDSRGDINVENPTSMQVSAGRELPANLRVPGGGNAEIPASMPVSADRKLPANLPVAGGGESINFEIPASLQVSADRELPANLRVPGGGNAEIPASTQVSADRKLPVNLPVAGGGESINVEIPASLQVSADRERSANLRLAGGGESINANLQVPGGDGSRGTDSTSSGRELAQQPPPRQQRRSAPGPWHEAASAVDTACTNVLVSL